MKGAIEASANIYNQALFQIGKPRIDNLNFKTMEGIEQDYVDAYERKKALSEEELASIEAIDSMGGSF